MQLFSLTSLLITFGGPLVVNASPIGKVLQLITDLQAKILAEGEGAQKVYEEFSSFCNDRSRELANDIKTGEGEKNELAASIQKASADLEALDAKIEDLGAAISKNAADLKAATSIREKEKSDFDAQASELTSVIDSLERAIAILEKEMRQAGASMLQLQGARDVTQALSVLVQASALSAKDGAKLTALVQDAQQDSSDDMAPPEAQAYEGHSGNIISTLENLQDKAKEQLSEARSKESAALNNFELLKQSLEDEIKVATSDLDEAKKATASTGEAKANAEGSLTTTEKDLAVDKTSLDDLHRDCMKKAQDFEAATKSRGEELAAIAKAKEIIQEKTAGADGVAYGGAESFVQLRRARLASATDLANYEAVRLIRDVARKEHSSALALLAARASTAMHAASQGGEDPFAKVKGLITDMIERLMDQAEAEASHKAYCDKELGESTYKKEKKTAQLEKLTTKINQDTARSAKLKEEVAALQNSLSELANAQVVMDSMREKEKKQYVSNKEELEKGLEGVKMALKVLRDYYAASGSSAHSADEGAGGGIIGLLEVCESDLSKSLAEIEEAEDTAKNAYDAETKENAVEKMSKTQDVKYNEKELASLEKSLAEMKSDQTSVQSELDAVLEYLKGLDQSCIAKAETYEERTRRREAELAGLKQALQILEGEAVLLEQRSKRSLRGTQRHSHTA